VQSHCGFDLHFPGDYYCDFLIARMTGIPSMLFLLCCKCYKFVLIIEGPWTPAEAINMQFCPQTFSGGYKWRFHFSISICFIIQQKCLLFVSWISQNLIESIKKLKSRASPQQHVLHGSILKIKSLIILNMSHYCNYSAISAMNNTPHHFLILSKSFLNCLLTDNTRFCFYFT
jgi:hypothetical protein